MSMSRRASGEKGRGTVTSAFGVSRREGHDADGFYSRFSPPILSPDDHIQCLPGEVANRILCGDSRSMPEVPDSSVALVVTSPPYFAGKEYEQDLAARHVPARYLDYLQMLEEVFAECVRKLEPGGRLAVNVANLGRKPYRSLSADVIGILQDRLGLLLRGEIIWQKALGSAGSCAWGSFGMPSNPVLRDLTERVIVASKGRFGRAKGAAERRAGNLPSVPSISTDEFMEATTDVWHIPSESATRVGHPAPFPVALPLRLIHLYTYEDDVVLDPFVGSGSTAMAAVQSGRRYVGYETDPSYVDLCLRRLAALETASVHPEQAALPPGRSAKEFAENLLIESGFTALEKDVTAAPGVEAGFRAKDAKGRPFLFELAGGFSISSAPGLKRGDILWRVIGKAAVLRSVDPRVKLVVLTTGVPAPGTPAGAALGAVRGPNRPIADVVILTSSHAPGTLSRLAACAD